MKRDIFERLVIEAVSALPFRVRKAMKNVAIAIEQEPRRKKSIHSAGSGLILSEVEGSSEVSIKRDETLLGLYEGIPLIQRNSGYFGVLPDKITIFQKSIEMLGARGKEEMVMFVREVVWHEIGHHFGLSDSELDILEKKRNKLVLPVGRGKQSA